MTAIPGTVRWPAPVASMIVVAAFALTAEPTCTVALRFHARAAVASSCIAMEDIAEVVVVEGDAACGDELAGVEIGRAAPPGYSRYVDTQQLLDFILAPRFPSVDFTVPDNPGRLTVRTTCRVLAGSSFHGAVRSWCREHLHWDDYTLEFADRADSIRCFDEDYTFEVKGPASSRARGPTQFEVQIAQGEHTWRVPVDTRITVRARVLVARNDIKRGTSLDRHKVVSEVRDITHFRYTPYDDLSDLADTRAARTLRAGTIIHDSAVRRIPLVESGDRLRLSIRCGAAKVSVPVRARERGGKGDRIWVENTLSHKLLRVVVRGRGVVVPISEEGV